jgi:hypothetical protein
MADPASSMNPAPIIPPPQPTPAPTAPDMPTMGSAPGDGLGAAAGAQPIKPAEQAPLHSKIAEGIIHAFSGTDGSAGSALRSALAGGLAGLAAAAKTPLKPGAPMLGGLGVGAEAGFNQTQKNTAIKNEYAQQQLENSQKQQKMDLEKQKEARETSTGDRDYDMRLREDGRQQAESLRKGVDFEKNSTLQDQAIRRGDYSYTKQMADDLQTYTTDWNDLTAHGGKILKVNGADSPEFDHLGDAQAFALKNFDNVAHPDMKTRLMRNPESHKWAIMETPYEPPKWHDFKDAAGKDQRVFTDTMGALAAEKEVAQTKHYLNVAGKSSLELKEDLERYKEEGTVKGARKELTTVGGDFTKLSPGSKSALLGDAQNQFTKVNTLLERIESKQSELRTPEEEETLAKCKPVRDSYASTIADLTRPSWIPKPGEEKPTATPKPVAPGVPAPPRPANVPPNFTFQNGAKGPGWYKNADAATAAPAQETETQPAL